MVLLSIFWFVLIWLVNYNSYNNEPFIAFFILIILSMTIILSYIVFNALTHAVYSKNAMALLTSYDKLTGLKNRDALKRDMENLINNDALFTVVFMDLDRFKSINDAYGHAKGDAYLKLFAQTFVNHFNDQNQVYRLSGDEFVLIHPGGYDQSLYQAIESFGFPKDAFDVKFLGVSLGHAQYPKDAEAISDLLHIADTNMYQVKKRRHAESAMIRQQKDDDYAT